MKPEKFKEFAVINKEKYVYRHGIPFDMGNALDVIINVDQMAVIY